MGTFEAFLHNMEQVYARMQSAQASLAATGMRVDPNIAEPRVLSYAVLRYSEEVARALTALADAVAIIIPGMVTYDVATMHTSIAIAALAPETPDAVQRANAVADTLAVALAGCHRSLREIGCGVRIHFDTVVINETTAIVTGIPNDRFHALAIHALDATAACNPTPPWGSHVTIARCAQASTGDAIRHHLPEAVVECSSMIRDIIDEVAPTALEVGIAQCDEHGMRMTPFIRIPF